MTQSIRIRRTLTQNQAPTGLAAGELAIEMSSVLPRLWVGVPTQADPALRRQVTGPEVYLPITGGTIYAPTVTDPLTIQADQGQSARIHYRLLPGVGPVPAGIEWQVGVRQLDGDFVASIPGSGLTQFLIEPSGLVAVAGNVLLGAAPTADMHAATKAYVDSLVVGRPFLPLAGGTLTGSLAINSTAPLSLVSPHDCYVAHTIADPLVPANNQSWLAGPQYGSGRGFIFFNGAYRLTIAPDGTVFLGDNQATPTGQLHALVLNASSIIWANDRTAGVAERWGMYANLGSFRLFADGIGDRFTIDRTGSVVIGGTATINGVGIQYAGLPIAQPQHLIGFEWNGANLGGWVNGTYVGPIARADQFLPLAGGTLTGDLTAVRIFLENELWLSDRAGGADRWALYDEGSTFRIWDGGDRLTIDSAGTIQPGVGGAIIVNGAFVARAAGHPTDQPHVELHGAISLWAPTTAYGNVTVAAAAGRGLYVQSGAMQLTNENTPFGECDFRVFCHPSSLNHVNIHLSANYGGMVYGIGVNPLNSFYISDHSPGVFQPIFDITWPSRVCEIYFGLNILGGAFNVPSPNRAFRGTGVTLWDAALVSAEAEPYTAGLAEIRRLDPVSEMVTTTPHEGEPLTSRAIGFAAAAAEEMPEFRLADTDEFVNYSPLLFVLVNAVKELADRLEAVERRR